LGLPDVREAQAGFARIARIDPQAGSARGAQ
jgi:hypothetical protein